MVISYIDLKWNNNTSTFYISTGMDVSYIDLKGNNNDEGLAKLFSKVVSYIDLKWNNNMTEPVSDEEEL